MCMSVFVYVLVALPPSVMGVSMIVVYPGIHLNFWYIVSTIGHQLSVTAANSNYF